MNIHDAARIISGRLKARGFNGEVYGSDGDKPGIGVKFNTEEGERYWAIAWKSDLADHEISNVEAITADHLMGLGLLNAA